METFLLSAICVVVVFMLVIMAVFMYELYQFYKQNY